MASELGSVWKQHWADYAGVETARRGGALAVRLDWSEPWDAQRGPGPESLLRTRLGLDDRLVSFSDAWASPFGQMMDQLKIPGWMAGDAPEAEETAVLLVNADGRIRFRWAERVFAYSRFGLEMEEGTP